MGPLSHTLRRCGRRFLSTGLFAAAFAAVPAMLGNAEAAAVTARPADAFVDSIGVNTHLYYSDTDYLRRFDVVAKRLRELGVRHIRENLVPDRPDQHERLRQLAAEGIRPTLILGEPTDGPAGLAELAAILAGPLRGAVAAVEGPNEWDLRGPSDWMGSLAAYQAELWSRIKGDPALAGLPVLGPSLGNTNSQATDISAHLDYGNIHPYPNAEPPEWNLSKRLGQAATMSGSKPVMATETGYHSALSYAGDHRPTSEDAEAVYLPRLFLEYYRQGVVRTFTYELLDEFPDPDRSEPESNFGLLRNDLSPKPAFAALKNLIAICSDPGGGSAAPGALDYRVGGDQENLRHLLLQKSDGSFYLALWRAESVWDGRSGRRLPAAERTVRVTVPGGVSDAQEYAPNASSEPLRSLPSGETLTLDVGPRVVILRIGAPPDRLGRIKAWVDRRAVKRGEPVTVKGRAAGAVGSRAVKVQRWRRGNWRTIGRAPIRRNGRFQKRIRLLGGIGPSRIRVIADRAKPSNPLRVRILARRAGSSSAIAVGSAQPAS